MTALWNMLLRSDLPADLFEDLPFAVFGLGDSSYEKFCWAAKMLSRRMKSLGASEICDRGEADEQDPLGCVVPRHLGSTASLRQLVSMGLYTHGLGISWTFFCSLLLCRRGWNQR